MKKLLILGLISAFILSSLLLVTSCGNESADDEISVVLSTMAAGDSFSLILRDGYVYAAGIARNGQLGFESREHTFNLTRIPNLSNIISVAAGGMHGLALTEDGTVYSWGRNDRGQLGIGSQETMHTPQRVDLGGNAKAIAAGGNISFALMDDGTVRSWGINDDGHLGNGEGESGLQSELPVTVLNLTNIVEIQAGTDHGVARDVYGNVYVWGYNYIGQMGDGTTVDVLTPIRANLPGPAVSVAANRLNTIVALQDGRVFAAGGGVDGEEGLYFSWDQTGSQANEFVLLSGLSNITKVSANIMSIFAVDEQGRIWAVGLNTTGNLGLGDTDDRIAPYEIMGFSGIVEITGGDWHTLIRRENGNIYGMGAGQFGQLAQGPDNRERATSPILIVN